MSRTANNLWERMMLLSDEQLAKVEHFVELLQVSGNYGLVRASLALIEPAFAAVWNNPEDDIYQLPCPFTELEELSGMTGREAQDTVRLSERSAVIR